MSSFTPSQAQQYLERWQLVAAFELEALRNTSMETKAQQLSALMASRDLFGEDVGREAGVREVRERWARIRQAFGD